VYRSLLDNDVADLYYAARRLHGEGRTSLASRAAALLLDRTSGPGRQPPDDLLRIAYPLAFGDLAASAAKDQQFSPLIRVYFYTSTYGGMERQFGRNFKLRAIGEYLRSWRVVGLQYAIAQATRPAADFEYSPTKNWSVQASVAYSRNMGIHAYDSVQSGFSVSYAMPFHRSFEEDGRTLPLAYPIRFSAGIQQETFYNFSAGNNRQFRPYIQISLF
jgi:hypothetical protein